LGRTFRDKLFSQYVIYPMISGKQEVFIFNARLGEDFNIPSVVLVHRQLDSNELLKSFVEGIE